MSGKPGRPNKIEQMATSLGVKPAVMVNALLNAQKEHHAEIYDQIKAVAADLGVNPRTVSRYAEAHLEYTCFWHLKGEKPIFASITKE